MNELPRREEPRPYAIRFAWAGTAYTTVWEGGMTEDDGAGRK